MRKNLIPSIIVALIELTGLIISVELYNAEMWSTLILILVVGWANFIYGITR